MDLGDRWDRLLEQTRRVEPEQLPLPTPAQLDLVKAALLPTAHSAPAWQRWKDRGLRLDTVRDAASMRLFPLLWSNREAAGISADEQTLLKGVYRHTVANNAATLAGGLNAAALVADAGIPVLFIKGAAVIATAGRMGLRRINDVDMLIPETAAQRAITVLRAAGYSDAKPDHRPVGFSHARGLTAPSGTAIDLHWWAFKTAGDDSSMFDTAREETLLGQKVLAASPTECLISAVANAFQTWGSPRLRWIADAMLLIDVGDIDWDLLLERSRRPGLTLRLAEGLAYLSRELAAPVPPRVLRELRARPVTWRERGGHWAALTRPTVGATVLEQLERHRARRLHRSHGLPQDFLWHMAQLTEDRRRDVVRRAPRTALHAIAVLLIRYARRIPRRARELD